MIYRGTCFLTVVWSEPEFLTFKKPKNRFQGTNSARLCSLAGRYDNPIPSLFLAPIDCLKIPALARPTPTSPHQEARPVTHKKTEKERQLVAGRGGKGVGEEPNHTTARELVSL